MPRYLIKNRITGGSFEVEAPFAQDACEKLGWAIGDCFVKILREGPHTDITRKSCPSCGWPEPYRDGDRCKFI